MKINIIPITSLLLLLGIYGFNRTGKEIETIEIGVVVSDMEKSLEFYTRVLGMEYRDTWHASEELVKSAGANHGKAFDIANLTLECDGYELNYKLNNTPGNISEDTRFANEKDYYGFEKLGTRYLTFNVKNIDPFLERIQCMQLNYKLVVLPNGRRVILIHDPDGALLEIASD